MSPNKRILDPVLEEVEAGLHTTDAICAVDDKEPWHHIYGTTLRERNRRAPSRPLWTPDYHAEVGLKLTMAGKQNPPAELDDIPVYVLPPSDAYGEYLKPPSGVALSDEHVYWATKFCTADERA